MSCKFSSLGCYTSTEVKFRNIKTFSYYKVHLFDTGPFPLLFWNEPYNLTLFRKLPDAIKNIMAHVYAEQILTQKNHTASEEKIRIIKGIQSIYIFFFFKFPSRVYYLLLLQFHVFCLIFWEIRHWAFWRWRKVVLKCYWYLFMPSLVNRFCKTISSLPHNAILLIKHYL